MSIKATDFIHILPIVSVMTFIIRKKIIIFSALDSGYQILDHRVTFVVLSLWFSLIWNGFQFLSFMT